MNNANAVSSQTWIPHQQRAPQILFMKSQFIKRTLQDTFLALIAEKVETYQAEVILQPRDHEKYDTTRNKRIW